MVIGFFFLLKFLWRITSHFLLLAAYFGPSRQQVFGFIGVFLYVTVDPYKNITSTQLHVAFLILDVILRIPEMKCNPCKVQCVVVVLFSSACVSGCICCCDLLHSRLPFDELWAKTSSRCFFSRLLPGFQRLSAVTFQATLSLPALIVLTGYGWLNQRRCNLLLCSPAQETT